MNIDFPIIKLYPDQQKIFNDIITDQKKFVACMATRRFGKDVTAFNVIVGYAAINRGNYYYFAPYFKQIQEIIVNGKLHDGRAFLDLVPRAMIKPLPLRGIINKSEMSLTLINESKIFFRGADNVDSQVGISAHGVVFTEADIMNPVFYRLIRPAIMRNINKTGKGFILFISTTRGINQWFTQLFPKYLPRKDDTPEIKAIKDRWALYVLPADKVLDHEGNRLFTDEQLLEERKELGDELFEQEYMCNINIAQAGSFYAKEIGIMYQEDRVAEFGNFVNGEYLDYWWKEAPIYISFDIGISDHTDLWFYQINPENGRMRFIHHYRRKGVGMDHYSEYIKDWCKGKDFSYQQLILPHDGDTREYSDAIRRSDKLRDMGHNVFVLSKEYIKDGLMEQIRTVRKYFGRVEMEEYECHAGLEYLKRYVKKQIKSTGEYLDQPDHNKFDKASDAADSFRYAVMYYHLFLTEGSNTSFSRSYEYDEYEDLGPIKY